MKKVIASNQAPAAIGTYSQAIKIGNTVYISGQIPLIADTMQLCEGDFKTHVKQIIVNIEALAQAAGGNLTHVVKLSVYLTDMDNFHLVNEVMASCWPQPYPARAAIEVSRLPKDVHCEMDAILVLEE